MDLFVGGRAEDKNVGVSSVEVVGFRQIMRIVLYNFLWFLSDMYP
jgi:hypothetical protein